MPGRIQQPPPDDPRPHRIDMPEARSETPLQPRGDCEELIPHAPSRSGIHQVAGIVRQLDGPLQVPKRPEPWKWASALMLFFAALPFLIVLWTLSIGLKLGLHFIGLRGGGEGILRVLLLHQLLDTLLRRPEPTPVYHYVIDSDDQLVSARQEGEFQDGRVFVGNQVGLLGCDRNGTLVIHSGFNETLGTALTLERRPWRGICLLLMVVTAFEYLVLIPVMAQP